jgi:enamine deaminase RidA (YjgF/YER057c/UK114 family)
MSQTVEERLAALGVTLPAPTTPAATYVATVLTGNQLFVSGQVSMGPDGLQYRGRLGADVTLADGRAAARLCAINILAQVKAALGDLDRIQRLVKVVGFVASTPDFNDQPQVVNGASDFFVEVLGERGRHARSSIGVVALPLGAPVEVEAIFAI